MPSFYLISREEGRALKEKGTILIGGETLIRRGIDQSENIYGVSPGGKTRSGSDDDGGDDDVRKEEALVGGRAVQCNPVQFSQAPRTAEERTAQHSIQRTYCRGGCVYSMI
jgi:hypothetical protein